MDSFAVGFGARLLHVWEGMNSPCEEELGNVPLHHCQQKAVQCENQIH